MWNDPNGKNREQRDQRPDDPDVNEGGIGPDSDPDEITSGEGESPR